MAVQTMQLGCHNHSPFEFVDLFVIFDACFISSCVELWRRGKAVWFWISFINFVLVLQPASRARVRIDSVAAEQAFEKSDGPTPWHGCVCATAMLRKWFQPYDDAQSNFLFVGIDCTHTCCCCDTAPKGNHDNLTVTVRFSSVPSRAATSSQQH